MLEELHVRDLALIEEAWLELGPGMTVLTGETGAGKTVLVGALQLLLGERADAGSVRAGSGEALIEGRFQVNGSEVTAKRRLSAEGRSKCYLDGEMATVAALAGSLGSLVELHGQHDHQALLDARTHAAYLDRFSGADASSALQGYEEAYRALREARGALAELEEALSDRERQADRLAYQIRDVDAVGPKAGEDEELERVLPRLRHAEKLAEASSSAYSLLRGDDGASDRAAAALSALSAVTGVDPALDKVACELDQALTLLDDSGATLRGYGESVEHDPRALDQAEARLAALAALKKKYGPTLDEVIAARQAAEERLAALDAGEAGLAESRAKVQAAESALKSAAGDLVQARRKAAPRFEAQLAEAAKELAMPKASFAVAFGDLPFESWTASGPEKVEFLFAPDAGEGPRPLARIASGGEISRVMLALKGVLGEADTADVLVFDEIDAGIGGATALAVGRRLAKLAKTRQVLVVTHLAQVAAFADAHVVVDKRDSKGRAVTKVTPVAGEDRVAEIARMLSGAVTEVSLQHARELLGQTS